MRYATTPGWVYVMLIVMGIGFMGGAGAFILFVPQPTGTIVGAIWLVMGAGFVFFSIRALRGRRDDERIRREGTPATATLLAAGTTGLIVNDVPQWKLRLRIDGAGASYEATMKLCTYSPPGNGTTFTVRIDPLRRQHVVLADDGAPVPAVNAAGFTGGVTDDLSRIGSPELAAAVAAALQQAGAGGTTSTVNADGSRTITMTTVDGGALRQAQDDRAPANAAETVRLLADLDRMHASGAIGDADFDALKRKLLAGE
jgi:hypothetical protein